MPISYKNKIYTTLGTPTVASGNGAFVTNSAGVPAKDYTVKGKSIVWNQLMDKSKFEANKTSGGVTFTNNGDGSVTVNGTATADAEYFLIGPSDKFGVVGHKYFLCGCPFRGSYNTYKITASIDLNGTWKNGFSDDGTAGGNISPALSSGEIIHIEITIRSGYTFNNLVFKPQLFDLTQMFGAGNEPATVAEFSAMFPDDYYPYNAGELKSVVPTSVEASGAERFQMFQNPNFSNTVVDTRDNVGFSVQQLASPYEVFFYQCLQEPGLVSGVFTIPVSGKCRIKHNGWAVDIDFYYFTSVKNHKYYIYINFTSTNPTVAGGVTYDKAQFFDLTEMFGAGNEPATPAEFWQRVPDKLYGYNPNDYKSANIPSSKYFPDGMKSAGSAYDEINFLSQKAIKRVGAVDMGTLNWSYSTTRTAFQTDDLNTKIEFPVTSSDTANLICTKYSAESYVSGWVGTIDKCCGTTFATAIKWFWVRDTAYTDAAAFKAAMSGVMLYYELATPVETAITPPLQALSTFKGFTSFSAPNSLMQNGPLSVTYYVEGGANPEKGWLTSYKRKLYMGRNIEWNQLFDKNKFHATQTDAGITIKNNGDGTFTINGTREAGGGTTWYMLYVNTENVSLAKKLYGHKILYGCVQNPSSGSTNNDWGICYEINDNMSNGAFTKSNLGESAVIATLNKVSASNITGAEFYFYFRPSTSGAAVYKDVIVRPQLFDLTQMFGAGNEPSTPEEFWSYFDHKLYPYNAGETQPLFKISRKSQWGSVVSYPNKGDLINIEGKQYRVLKTSGNVVEVLAMYNPSSVPQRFGTTQIYANSFADTYCNETFYSGLSSTLQNAIVEKTFTQDSWFRGDSGHSSAIEVYQGVSTDINYVMSLMNKSFGTSITRKCYMISIQDIIDYIGATTAMTVETTTLKQENIWKLFWNQSTKPGTGAFYYPWLRSASANDSYTVFDINSNTGRLDYDSSQNEYIIRPAFQIDLSKISWTKSE